MCTDLGPDIQNNEHATIVPALTEVMKDFNEPRVQAHAAAAIVNFSENCDEEILTGYLDALISQLLGLLQNGQKLVKVIATNCIGGGVLDYCCEWALLSSVVTHALLGSAVMAALPIL